MGFLETPFNLSIVVLSCAQGIPHIELFTKAVSEKPDEFYCSDTYVATVSKYLVSLIRFSEGHEFGISVNSDIQTVCFLELQ